MKKITAIFALIVLLAISSFAILWGVNPQQEQDRTMATQGIRLVGSAVFYSAGNSTVPNRIRVGDLLLGSNEQVFRINELRKSQSNTIYVVVSWKYITDYTTYSQYLSEPYANYQTYELNSFAYTKTIITEPELSQFYQTYTEQLALQQQAKSQPSGPQLAAPAVAAPSSPPPPPPPAPLREAPSTRNILRGSSAEVQAYATAEISKPEDVTPEQIEELERVLKQVKDADQE